MGQIVHVMPVNDIVEHEDDDCICGPRTDAVPCDDGSYGWVIVHESLDRREDRESTNKQED